MKKLLSFVLAAVLLLSLCACGGSGSATTETQTQAVGLQAGFARENITPDGPVGMSGYQDSATRRMKGVLDYIYATCVALRSGEETLLVYTIDMIAMKDTWADKVRTTVSEATGIPTDYIMVGATHTHSGPDIEANEVADIEWQRKFMDACATAGKNALKDLADAQLQAATAELTNMNFVRHYEMEDGTHAGSNFGDFSKKIVGHSAESDPQAVLIKFDREGDKKDVLMVNFQAHPDRGTELGRYQIAASWIGPLRDELERLSGMQVAYFTGASGNQNADSKIPEEAHNLDWMGYGTKLGQIFNDKLADLQPVEGTEMKQTKVVLDLEIDHSWDHMLPQANEVFDLWKSGGKSAGDALGKTYNFTSSYQARAIRSRAAKPATEEMETRAFRIGPIGFTTGTYEMFSTHGLYVKRNSPFEITFLITANSGYLPDVPAYDYRSYEADTGMFAPGEAEELAENYVEMLKTLK